MSFINTKELGSLSTQPLFSPPAVVSLQASVAYYVLSPPSNPNLSVFHLLASVLQPKELCNHMDRSRFNH